MEGCCGGGLAGGGFLGGTGLDGAGARFAGADAGAGGLKGSAGNTVGKKKNGNYKGYYFVFPTCKHLGV